MGSLTLRGLDVVSLYILTQLPWILTLRGLDECLYPLTEFIGLDVESLYALSQVIGSLTLRKLDVESLYTLTHLTGSLTLRGLDVVSLYTLTQLMGSLTLRGKNVSKVKEATRSETSEPSLTPLKREFRLNNFTIFKQVQEQVETTSFFTELG
jgi:hypothetical protein